MSPSDTILLALKMEPEKEDELIKFTFTTYAAISCLQEKNPQKIFKDFTFYFTIYNYTFNYTLPIIIILRIQFLIYTKRQ